MRASPLFMYFRYLGYSIQSQLQYRQTFIIQSCGQFLISIIDFVGMWALFSRFKVLGEWSFAECALFYGITNCAFSLGDALGAGFDHFTPMIKQGDFDRCLVRPRSTLLQIAGLELTMRRMGRLIQGLIVLSWAIVRLPILWSPLKILLVFEAVAGGTILFTSLFIFQGALTFFTIESLEIINTMTYGGRETAQYPMNIYPVWLQRFFTFIVPLALAVYFPVCAILEKGMFFGLPYAIGYFSPLGSVLFLGLTIVFWHYGVRKYTSSGS